MPPPPQLPEAVLQGHRGAAGVEKQGLQVNVACLWHAAQELLILGAGSSSYETSRNEVSSHLHGRNLLRGSQVVRATSAPSFICNTLTFMPGIPAGMPFFVADIGTLV